MDVIPTILAMIGADKKQKPGVMEKLHGHDVSQWLTKPEKAPRDGVREAALYNFGMWSFMDADWLGKIFKARAAGEKLTLTSMQRPDTSKRSAIRSAFDGRYKFNHYFNFMRRGTVLGIAQLRGIADRGRTAPQHALALSGLRRFMHI